MKRGGIWWDSITYFGSYQKSIVTSRQVFKTHSSLFTPVAPVLIESFEFILVYWGEHTAIGRYTITKSEVIFGVIKGYFFGIYSDGTQSPLYPTTADVVYMHLIGGMGYLVEHKAHKTRAGTQQAVAFAVFIKIFIANEVFAKRCWEGHFFQLRSTIKFALCYLYDIVLGKRPQALVLTLHKGAR